MIYDPRPRESDNQMNIWSRDPVSASLFDLDVTFSEAMELNLRAAGSFQSDLFYFCFKFGNKVLISVSTSSSLL